MKTKNIRIIISTVIFVLLALGLILNIQMGTLSGFGFDTFSALCPLGGFLTMLSTRTFLPRAVISIIVMGLLVLVVGRAFCGWICPVTLINHTRDFFRSPKKRRAIEAAKRAEAQAVAADDFKIEVKGHDCKSCGACKQKHGKLDSRHAVLGGALASTAIFGFPVFCLVCPVGLTFATILLVWRLFSAGDMTWSVILIPALLIIEVFLLRKWCTRFCPIAGLMNLASRFSKTFRPEIDDSKCLETAHGTACGKCAAACDFDINLRHIEYGERTLKDCTRCRACVDVCPTKAIHMPFMPSKKIEKVIDTPEAKRG